MSKEVFPQYYKSIRFNNWIAWLKKRVTFNSSAHEFYIRQMAYEFAKEAFKAGESHGCAPNMPDFKQWIESKE